MSMFAAQGWRFSLVRRQRRRANRGEATVGCRRLHLREHEVEDPVEQVVLVRDVVVERHRFVAERLAELRIESASIPSSSARTSAVSRMRSRFRGFRRVVAIDIAYAVCHLTL